MRQRACRPGEPEEGAGETAPGGEGGPEIWGDRAGEGGASEAARGDCRDERRLERARNAWDACRTSLAECDGKIAQIKGQLEQGAEVDREKAEKAREALEAERTGLETRRKLLFSRREANGTALENIRRRSGRLEELEREWAMVQALSNTAGGNVSGREKIMLETYIQMTYFDRIIDRANTRFMIMSGGQYELKRRERAMNNQSQSGLELDVIDHYNGSERSVRTLSGGESFQASLSLALGLSDEIQSLAGGIRLESMFVDEGFGSLMSPPWSRRCRLWRG